jgi:hypothetical protein
MPLLAIAVFQSKVRSRVHCSMTLASNALTEVL